jgi:hypothetical protein
MVAAIAGFSQGSLTDEFARMNPRERARVAQREQEEARNDTGYQAKMAEGETLFQQSRYEEAMAVFEVARSMRPLNVYPKVKIEDLKVLIRQRDERTAAEQAKAGEAVPPEQNSAQPEIPASGGTVGDVGTDEKGPETIGESLPGDTTRAIERAAQPTIVDVRSASRSTPKPMRAEAARGQPALRPQPTSEPPPPASPPPDGVVENRYKQGSAQVTEMMVTANGRTTVFKRVAHKYGQVYYFEGGQAIDGRVWRERFGEKP